MTTASSQGDMFQLEPSALDALWVEALASLQRYGSVAAIARANWAAICEADPRWKDFGQIGTTR